MCAHSRKHIISSYKTSHLAYAKKYRKITLALFNSVSSLFTRERVLLSGPPWADVSKLLQIEIFEKMWLAHQEKKKQNMKELLICSGLKHIKCRISLRIQRKWSRGPKPLQNLPKSGTLQPTIMAIWRNSTQIQKTPFSSLKKTTRQT